MANKKASLRSQAWFGKADKDGFLHRSWMKNQGIPADSFDGRPVIGICNTFSELTPCNAHLRGLAERVKRGVYEAGGLPLEFPVMSLGEFNMRPTTMLFRNLMSMVVEESIRANPLDAVVLLGGCDKTTPALLMGAASADVPAILVTGGPQLSAHWRGETLGSCTDCRRYHTELRAGNISAEDWGELQGVMVRSAGHCMTIGTASTMATLGESLGMALPGNAAFPAVDARRAQLAQRSGKRAVALAANRLRPSKVMSPAAFENAIRTLHAIGGSTNAIVHLIAIAGRLGIDLPLKLFDQLSDSTPLLLNLKPSGQYLMEDFCYAGGAPALLKELTPLLHQECLTVSGKTLGANIAQARIDNADVIRPLANPLQPDGGLAVLRGSLAPGGAIIKRSAASPQLLSHRGPAVVFEDHEDLLRRIDDDNLDVTRDSVLVMKNGGPLGGPGMPEWGLLPIPKKLLDQGVRDMVRISDARISGTAFGTVVVHVTPESAAGGPLGIVETGDLIELDVSQRRLDLCLPTEELDRRLANAQPRAKDSPRGHLRLYQEHVLQADQGCDFDFLRAEP